MHRARPRRPWPYGTRGATHPSMMRSEVITDLMSEDPTIEVPAFGWSPMELPGGDLVPGGMPAASTPPRFGPAELGRVLLEVENQGQLLDRAFEAWSTGFEVSGELAVRGDEVSGIRSLGLSQKHACRFRRSRTRRGENWLVDQVIRDGQPYLGEGSAEVGSTWLTDQLCLSPRARLYVIPIQEAGGEVRGLFVGNGAARPVAERDLQLMRAAIRAAHRLVQARGALERLAREKPARRW